MLSLDQWGSNPVDDRTLVSHLSLRIAGGPGAPAEARKALRRFHPELPAELFQTVALLASELVSNAVLHSRSKHIDLSSNVVAACVRVEVANAGPSFSALPVSQPVPGVPGGWGLYMVDELASRWGVSQQPTMVWFEIDR